MTAASCKKIVVQNMLSGRAAETQLQIVLIRRQMDIQLVLKMNLKKIFLNEITNSTGGKKELM